MSTGPMTPTDRPPDAGDVGLAGRELPRWMLPVVCVAAVLVALGSRRGHRLHGPARPRRGRAARSSSVRRGQLRASRAAAEPIDRLATTLIYSALRRWRSSRSCRDPRSRSSARAPSVLNADFLTHSLRNIGPDRHGRRRSTTAIIGTLEQALVTSLIAVPIGVLVADLPGRVRPGHRSPGW